MVNNVDTENEPVEPMEVAENEPVGPVKPVEPMAKEIFDKAKKVFVDPPPLAPILPTILPTQMLVELQNVAGKLINKEAHKIAEWIGLKNDVNIKQEEIKFKKLENEFKKLEFTDTTDTNTKTGGAILFTEEECVF
jgi:hypothetical protein